MLTFDLPTIWAFIIAFAIFAYVVMDGFDLGIGILFSWIPVGRERDTAINTIAPVWDGNETWLVLGGGGLLAAFPLAYGTILSALYAPIVAMLLALIFRGVAFEFRWRDPRHRPYWDIAFSLGSIVAALAQGITLGALLQGIAVENRAYAGGWFDWLTPFSVLVGVSLVCGYALLGSTWLIMKSEGTLQARSYPGQDAPLHSVGSWSYVLARPDLPEKTAYLLARAIHWAEAPLAARLPQARETTMANTLNAAPRPELIHPGVLRYLREAGIPGARQ